MRRKEVSVGTAQSVDRENSAPRKLIEAREEISVNVMFSPSTVVEVCYSIHVNPISGSLL